ncbi:MAG TPA: DnaJ domain-containing protein [Gammaproteobacteria bacterium]
MHPIFFLAVLVAVLVFVSWYKRAPKATRKSIGNKILIVGGIGLLLVLILTGRLNPIFAAVAALIPLAYRALGLLQLITGLKGVKNAFKAAGGPAPGQKSDVETHFLKMSLNHDTGEMDGEIIDGAQKGKRLSELELPQLMQLLSEFRRQDAQSAAVLEAYLERTFGAAWREGGNTNGDSANAGTFGGSMTPQEARRILEVEENATREQIIDAHRRLMQKLHPDRGGSTYLAAQINAAKETLLGA